MATPSQEIDGVVMNPCEPISFRRLSPNDFQDIQVIGRGAFAEVKVVRKLDDNRIYAMKVMNKSELVKKQQVDHIRAERDILTLVNSPWIVNLVFSFQDDSFLYLVMDFLQGGDLMSILIRQDILSSDASRFYIAETALSIHAVHQLNYIHRDLKPDNILIDKDGHVKLSDFGLCKAVKAADVSDTIHNMQGALFTDSTGQSSSIEQMRQQYHRRARKVAYSTVGTPDYIAPEVLSQGGYDEACDWWSLGVILYECLVGCAPFFSDDPRVTCNRIVNYQRELKFPAQFEQQHPAAYDLIINLICDHEHRLTFEQIKTHPFFLGVDWEHMRETTPPFIPELSSETDASYFDPFESTLDTETGPSSGTAQGLFDNFTFRNPKHDVKPNLTSLFDHHQ